MMNYILKPFSRATSQSGFSIVTVMIALAFVAAGTTYIISMNKNNRVAAAAARSTSFSEMERRRVSGILSNNTTCSRPGNFGGQNFARPDIAGLETSAGSSLVTRNGTYFNKTLTLTNITTRIYNPNLVLNPGLPPNPFLGTAKQYELVLTYTDAGAGRSTFTGKKTTVIRIPMYMKLDGSNNVLDCYTMGENNEVDTVITRSCSPGTGSATARAYLNQINGVASDCQNNIDFDDVSNANLPNTTCAANYLMTGIMTNPAAVGGSLRFQAASICGGLPGISGTTACSTGTQAIYSVNGSVLGCADVALTGRDTVCGAGQILYRTGTSSIVCLTVNCSTANEFVYSVTSGGPTCYKAPATSCASGKYIHGFDQNGNDICEDLPVISGACSSGQYGYSITRATASSGGTLNCQAYTKTKTCPSPSNTTFAYRLHATGATCTTY